MVSKKTKKVATTAVASFGVAMAAVYVAPEINADILDITWNGGNATASNPYFPAYGSAIGQDVDQVPNGMLTTALGMVYELPGDLLQWNDTFGRTMPLYVTATTGGAPFVGGAMSMLAVNEGDVIDPNTFVGAQTSLGGAPAGIGGGTATTFDGTGSAFVAIRPRVAPDTLFWYRVDFTNAGAMIYGEGQYGDAGEALTVGDVGGGGCDFEIGDVNQDDMVSLLDVAPFVDAVLAGDASVCEADINEDLAVDLLDVGPFVDLLLGG